LQEEEKQAGETDVPGLQRSQADVNLKFQFSVMLEQLSIGAGGAERRIVSAGERFNRGLRLREAVNCEPTGRANACPMTGCAKQSILSL
jgi:hypothetical protein